jgi:sugar O-acyltransferase (sialic acid O-acetyltransferase NeuD family)
MDKLLIFPYNGNGLEALDCLGGKYDFIGFIDDTPAKQGLNENGLKVFSRTALDDFPDAFVLAVPGSPSSYSKRHGIIGDLNLSAERYATIIHPSATVSPLAKIGKNTLLMAGVVLTSNCSIGDHVCILPNTVIHHDSSVGNYTLIGSNVTVAGNTTIGNGCYIGSGTSIINGISIGDRSLIGMGSNVIRGIAADSKVAGNPTKIL